MIVAPRKFDVLKTNICPRSEASRANLLVLRTSNFQGATIRPIVPRHKHSIDPYHSMSKQKILPVEPLIQCEAGRAKTIQRQSLYSPRTPKWPPSDKGELSLLFTTKFSSARQLKNHVELFSTLLD